MALALSTSWLGGRFSDLQKIPEALKRLNVLAVELDYRLNRRAFEPLQGLLRQCRIDILSLHNFCPCPEVDVKRHPSGDYFSLSSLDRHERNAAVDWTTRTIELANACEAGRVVLHCGSLPASPSSTNLYQRAFSKAPSDDSIQRVLQNEPAYLDAHRAPYLDALFFSLDSLITLAEKYQVILGIENRYRFFELPGFEEMSLILSEFAGAPIGYWHDSGHAHAQQVLGLVSQEQWIDRYGEHMVGIHLHDAKSLRDHMPPGNGEIDFSVIEPFFNSDIPIVVELAPGASDADLQQAVDVARLLEGRPDAPGTDFSLDLPDDFH